MAGTVKGLVVELGGDTSALKKALSNVNSNASSLSKELKGVNSLLKFDSSNTEMLSQKQIVLKKNIEQTEDKLYLLKKAQKEADEAIANGTEISEENYRALQREIVNTENKLGKLKLEASNWTNSGKSIEEFGNKIKGISDKVDKVGTTLTTRLTLPIAGLITAATKLGVEFEAQMSRVQAVAGATKDELKQLTDQAIELGAKTSFGATDVAEAMENLASAGFNTKEIMQAIPGLLDLAASSGAELGTSAEITASAIRGFGLEAEKSSHIADVFATAAARTNAQTEDMGEAMKYVAPVAKAVGLNIEETAAAIGIMSDAGIKGSQAGTTLRGGLTRIVKPTKQVKTAMETLGVSFYDNNGKMKSLTEIIATLQEKTKGLSDETKNQALAQIFGTEALSGMLALINRGSGELDAMTKSFQQCDGAAEKMAETMLDNTAGSIEEMRGSLESASIAIQKALAPTIRDIAKKIETLVNKFNGLSEAEKKNMVKTALLVAAMGPAIKIVSTFGGAVGTTIKGVGLFSQAIGVVVTQSKSANPLVNNLAGFIKGLISPAGLATTTIMGLGGAVLYFATQETEAQKEARKFAEAQAEAKKSMEEYYAEIDKNTEAELSHIDYVKKLKSELTQLVDENGKVKEGYKGRVDFILKQLNEALGTEYKLNGDVIESYKTLQNEIDKTIEKKRAEIFLNASEEKYKNAIENQKQAIEDLATAHDNLGMSYEEAKAKLENYEKAISSIPFGVTDWERLFADKEMEPLKNHIQAFEDAEARVKTYTENIKIYENDYANFTNQKYSEIGNTIITNTENWTSKTLEELQKSIDEQVKKLNTYKKIYETTGNEVALQLANQAQTNLDALAKELADRTQTLTELGPQEVEAWKSIAEQSYGAYNEQVSLMSPTMQEKIQEATGVIIASTPEMKAKAALLGQQTINEFNKSAEAKENALKTLQGYLQGLDDETKKELLKQAGIEDVDTVLKELDRGDLSEKNGRNILQGLWKGLKNGTWMGKILGAAAGIAQAVNKQFTGKSGWDEHSPSKKMKKYTELYLQPIEDVMQKKKRSILSSAEDLASSINNEFDKDILTPQIQDFGKLQGSLSNKVIDGTKTIFTTPNLTIYTQEFNARKIANEVNRVFGSQY